MGKIIKKVFCHTQNKKSATFAAHNLPDRQRSSYLLSEGL